MSQNKTPEERLKEAVEASKIALALNEQVVALAAEKEGLLKRLAEVEKAVSTPKAESNSMNDEVKVLLAAQTATISELKAQIEGIATQARKAKNTKADLNEYVQKRIEDGEEGNTPAEKQHRDAGVESEEACGPEWKKSKKGKKAEMPEFIKEKIEEEEEEEGEESSAWDEDQPVKFPPVDTHDAKKVGKKASKKAGWDEDGDFGDLDDEEVQLIKEYRRQNDYYSKKGKKADSNLKNPTVEEGKNFDKELPQPGLDPEKNNVNEDNTTSPTMAKKAKKASVKKGETDVEEIMESPDKQEEEGEEHTHEKTLAEPEMGAKKHGKKAENMVEGVNQKEVTRTKEECEEEGEGSFLDKKDAKKGKKADESEAPAPVAKSTDIVDEAVAKLTALAQAKVHAEAEAVKVKEMLASETKAKTEAVAAVEALHKKFEALMSKVQGLESSDKALEAKAAKIVASQAVEPVASEVESDVKPMTDGEILAKFESITDSREKNKFFNSNRIAIERAAHATLRRRS